MLRRTIPFVIVFISSLLFFSQSSKASLMVTDKVSVHGESVQDKSVTND